MALQRAGVQLVVDGSAQATAAMQSFGRAVNDAADQTMRASGRVSSAGQIMVGALRQVGVVAVDAFLRAGRAAIGFVGDSVKAAGDFQQGMNVLQAVTSATDAEMSKLQQTAIALGNDITLPATSATDAAEAMTELAKAGLSVDQAMAAAKGTLQLATAAQTDNANAAQIVAGALNAFHMEGEQAVQVADLLAAAANASSASMTDLSQGLQQGGFMFNATGQKVDDLVASLAILTNVGLTGSDAGTALKNMMTRLVAPTDKAAKLMAELGINVFNAQGEMLPLRDVIEVLNGALAGMTQQQRLDALETMLLSDGMKAMLPLLDAGAVGFDAMKEKINQQGAAAQMAGAQTTGFNGALAAAKNAVETLGLIIGTALLPPLTEFLNTYITPGVIWLGSFAQALAASSNPALMLAQALGLTAPQFQAIIAAAQPVVGFIQSNLTPILQALAGVLGGIVVSAIASAVASFATIAAPIAAAIALGAALHLAWNTNFAGIQTTVTTILTAVLAYITAVGTQILVFWQNNGASIMAFAQTTWAQISEIVTIALEIISIVVSTVFTTIANFINAHGTEIQAYLSAAWEVISTIITGTLETIKGLLAAALAVLKGDWEGAWEAIVGVVDAQLAAAQKILKSGLDLLIGAIKLSVAAFVDAATSLGAGIINGIVSGVKDGAGKLYSTLKDIATSALDAAKAAIGVSSPSKAFAKEVGRPAIEGFALGAQQAAGELTGTMASIAADALSAAKAPLATAGSIGSGLASSIAKGIQSGAGAAISAAKSLADKIRDALSVSSGGGGGGWGGGLSLGGSSGGGSWSGGLGLSNSIAPVATAAQILSAGATTVNNTQSRTYHYAPTYGAAPRAPSVDFATMAAWGS